MTTKPKLANAVRRKIKPLDSNGNLTADGLKAGWRQTIWRGHEFITIKWNKDKQFQLNYWIDGAFGQEDGFESLTKLRARCGELMKL